MLDPRYKVRVLRLRNVPATPANFAGVDASNERDIDLSWDAPPNIVVDNYTIEHTFIDIDGEEITLATIVVGGDQTTKTVACWQDTHKFRITANNAEGSSSASDWISVAVAGGFTTFDYNAADTIVYVSSTLGSDSNDGLSRGAPKATIAAGYGVLTSGQTDWLLLRDGDEWTEGLGHWRKIGTDATHPMVVAPYHTTTPSARPLLKTGTNPGIYREGGGGSPASVDYLTIAGLDFYAHSRTASTGSTGVSWLDAGDYVKFEDCLVRGYVNAFSIQKVATSPSNFTVNRCIGVDSYHDTAHSQGLFAATVLTLTINECVFDHNGWDDAAESPPDIYKHNLYISASNTGVTVTGNILTRASSHGLQLRCGGTATSNLVAGNPIGILLGGGDPVAVSHTNGITGTVSGNVITEGTDIDGSNPRGWGIELANIGTSGATLANNIIYNKTTTTAGFGIRFSADSYGSGVGVNDVAASGNIIYNWNGGFESSNAAGSPPSPSSFCTVADNTVDANDIQEPTATDDPLATIASTTNAAFTNNRYYTTKTSSARFSIASVNKSYAQWVSDTGETGSSEGAVSYVAPSRTIGTYHASIGGTATTAAFITAARAQWRYNWNSLITAEAAIAYIAAGFAE